MNAVIDVHKLSKCSRPVLRPFFRGAPRYFRALFPLFFLFFSLAGWFSFMPGWLAFALPLFFPLGWGACSMAPLGNPTKGARPCRSARARATPATAAQARQRASKQHAGWVSQVWAVQRGPVPRWTPPSPHTHTHAHSLPASMFIRIRTTTPTPAHKQRVIGRR